MSGKPHHKLNLGCGQDKRESWLNVDVVESVNPDKVVDLEDTPWPFEDDSFLIVEARHVLEHLETVPWDEIERIMKPGATFRLVYPIGFTRFEDPTHKQFFNWDTATNIAGYGKHDHELGLNLRLVSTDYEGAVVGDPLMKLYAWYRKKLTGSGAWLEQVPGFAGERKAIYRYCP